MRRLLVVLLMFAVHGAAHATLQIQNWTLTNGARVFFVENHSLPVIDASVEFDAGGRRDPAGKSGTAALANSMLARGVREGRGPNGEAEPALNEARISDGFADIAAQRGGAAGADRSGLTLRTLSTPAERDRAVLLAARVLAQPAYPESFLQRDKARTVANLREQLTRPEAIASKAFWRTLYGAHPYGDEPTEASVGAITRADLLAFHAKYFVANHAVVAMIGDLTRDQADAIARQLTARLPQGGELPPLPPVTPAVASTPPREQRIPHPASQAHILMGMPALERGDPDFFSLLVGNYVLGGGGLVSRLTNEVREKRGLTYSVNSFFMPMAQPGPFEIGLQTAKKQTNDALKVVLETVNGFLAEGPTEAEVKAAKDNLIGGFPLRIDNNRKILDNVAVIGFYGLPLDYLDTWTANVAKVGIPEIRAAFARHVAVNRLSTVIVGAE
jgi:zinc protease